MRGFEPAWISGFLDFKLKNDCSQSSFKNKLKTRGVCIIEKSMANIQYSTNGDIYRYDEKLPPNSTDPDEFCTPNANPYATYIKIRFKPDETSTFGGERMWGVILVGDENKGVALLKSFSVNTKHQFNDIVKYEGDGKTIPEAIEVFDGNDGESAIDPYFEAVGDERIYMLIDL